MSQIRLTDTLEDLDPLIQPMLQFLQQCKARNPEFEGFWITESTMMSFSWRLIVNKALSAIFYDDVDQDFSLILSDPIFYKKFFRFEDLPEETYEYVRKFTEEAQAKIKTSFIYQTSSLLDSKSREKLYHMALELLKNEEKYHLTFRILCEKYLLPGWKIEKITENGENYFVVSCNKSRLFYDTEGNFVKKKDK